MVNHCRPVERGSRVSMSILNWTLLIIFISIPFVAIAWWQIKASKANKQK